MLNQPTANDWARLQSGIEAGLKAVGLQDTEIEFHPGEECLNVADALAITAGPVEVPSITGPRTDIRWTLAELVHIPATRQQPEDWDAKEIVTTPLSDVVAAEAVLRVVRAHIEPAIARGLNAEPSPCVECPKGIDQCQWACKQSIAWSEKR